MQPISSLQLFFLIVASPTCEKTFGCVINYFKCMSAFKRVWVCAVCITTCTYAHIIKLNIIYFY
jgi:hypothetical protein